MSNMLISDLQIIEACRVILAAVEHHQTERRERRFLNAYQIWLLLESGNLMFCQQLEQVYGFAKGKGGGNNVGPIQRIAQALGRCSDVETQYMDTRYIMVGELKPSGEDCGLFRLRY